MKKLMIFACLIAGGMMSCSKQESKLPEGAVGYVIDKSANIDLAKKSMQALSDGDSATYRATYSEDAVFYDNADTITLDQNVSLFTAFKAKGITMKLDSIPNITETIYNEPGYFGANHFVYAYAWFTLTRGDKSVRVIIHSVDGIKDGKQVVEWLRYDTKKINEIMQ
jgi:hypothetical protein